MFVNEGQIKLDSEREQTRTSRNQQPHQQLYLSMRGKMWFAICTSSCWVIFCTILALPWINDLSRLFGLPLALLIVCGVALIPGWANAYLITGLLLDRRPIYQRYDTLPPVSVLVAAYNEQDCIAETLHSVARQQYPGEIEVIVVNDGSADDTAGEIERAQHRLAGYPHTTIHHIDLTENGGKAAALNRALQAASHAILVTIDADTCIYRDSLVRLVTNLIDGPPKTAAVAGTVLVKNSRDSLMTRLQEWDYFLGIAVVKRIQSLYQGTLVAQGAFSAYWRDAIEDVGGWEDTVGEDIVLTWALHKRGYRVNYAENAFVFTEVPQTYKQFFRQRQRWARGLIEAFKRHPGILLKLRPYSPFVYFNILFPYLDAAFLLFFLPGVIAALFFKFYALVGIMTLLLLPLLAFINIVMYFHQSRIFKTHGLKVRRNVLGLFFYMFFYQAVMSPASLAGYLSELLRFKKSWGTK